MLILFRRPRRFARAYRWALMLSFLGAAADAATTLRNMQLYGPGIELHLVQRLFSEVLGVSAGVPLAKITQFAFVVFVASWWRPWCPWILGVCGILYGLAAVSNHFLLL